MIGENGHVKLTDFGLSRVGFLGRRARGMHNMENLGSAESIPASPHSTTSVSLFSNTHSPRPLSTQPSRLSELIMSNSSRNRRSSISSIKSANSEDVSGQASSPILSGRLDALLHDEKEEENPMNKRFVGTPDYLAPESILGIAQDSSSVDWVSSCDILLDL